MGGRSCSNLRSQTRRQLLTVTKFVASELKSLLQQKQLCAALSRRLSTAETPSIALRRCICKGCFAQHLHECILGGKTPSADDLASGWAKPTTATTPLPAQGDCMLLWACEGRSTATPIPGSWAHSVAALPQLPSGSKPCHAPTASAATFDSEQRTDVQPHMAGDAIPGRHC